VFGVSDSGRMMEVACCWLSPPRSAAPQSADRGGQVDLYGQRRATHGAGPYSCVVPPIAGVTGWHLRQGRPGAPFPVGLGTLQVMHHGIPQPSTTSWGLGSPAWRLSGACCSRERVVCSASRQGLIGYLSIQGVSTFFHTAFTAHSDVGAEQLSWLSRGPLYIFCNYLRTHIVAKRGPFSL
jgi:hypothetical protein